jgi:hypothetical protein
MNGLEVYHPELGLMAAKLNVVPNLRVGLEVSDRTSPVSALDAQGPSASRNPLPGCGRAGAASSRAERPPLSASPADDPDQLFTAPRPHTPHGPRRR